MAKGLLGKKLGMTQIFDENGKVIPVTVIETGPCVVTQIRNEETDGYNALQLGFGAIKEKKVTKPQKGHFAKAGVAATKYLKEFKYPNTADYQLGQEIRLEDVFAEGEYVDVTGLTKGKGYAGVIKRWGFSRGPMSHGVSLRHRPTGSLGVRTPARVLPGRKMSGRLGNEKVTIQKLLVVKVDAQRNLLLIKGSVPGVKGCLLTVKQTVKNIK